MFDSKASSREAPEKRDGIHPTVIYCACIRWLIRSGSTRMSKHQRYGIGFFKMLLVKPESTHVFIGGFGDLDLEVCDFSIEMRAHRLIIVSRPLFQQFSKTDMTIVS
jgi:hypothetical protein